MVTAGAVAETRLNWTRVNESGPPCRQRGGIWAPRLMAVHLLPALFICLCCLFAGGGRRGISGGGPRGKRDCEQRIQMGQTRHRSFFARENPANRQKKHVYLRYCAFPVACCCRDADSISFPSQNLMLMIFCSVSLLSSFVENSQK